MNHDMARNDAAASSRYARRLSDVVLIAFHRACDHMDIKVAWSLLDVLEFMTSRETPIPNGIERRRVREGLIAAHERLWQIRHPDSQDG
jgi:hypothetical protein